MRFYRLLKSKTEADKTKGSADIVFCLGFG